MLMHYAVYLVPRPYKSGHEATASVDALRSVASYSDPTSRGMRLPYESGHEATASVDALHKCSLVLRPYESGSVAAPHKCI